MKLTKYQLNLEKLCSVDFEYPWEYEIAFGQSLKKIFKDTFERRMTNDGVYNLLFTHGNCYEIKFSCNARKYVEDKLGNDTIKNEIISAILNCLPQDIKYTANNKVITFELKNKIAKIEIIKKRKIPK